MRVLSVNVGVPREIVWRGEAVETSILKAPVSGRVMVRTTNLDGDRQADLSVHGGPLKAVYAYASEHYPFWQAFLGRDLPMGALGENLTLEGLTEEACVGDRLRIGSAELTVVQPRMPCYKLAALYGREDIVAAFLRSGRSGVYFRVDREGDVGAGDEVVCLERDPRGVRIADLNAVLRGEPVDPTLMRRAAAMEILPPFWRNRLAKAAA